MHKNHNVSLLLYHLVCSTKYHRFFFKPKGCPNQPVTGISVQEQDGYGIVNAALQCNPRPVGGSKSNSLLDWGTTNFRGMRKGVSFNNIRDFATGIEVSEQDGYGIIDMRLVSQRGNKTQWVTKNPDGHRILSYNAPPGQRIIGFRLREQDGYGVVDVTSIFRGYIIPL